MLKLHAGLLVICLTVGLTASSQQTIRLSAYTGTGISSFIGMGSAAQSTYYRNGLPFPNAVDSIGNHFGRNLKGNFLAGLQAEVLLSSGWVVLLCTQYEHTGSGLTVDSIITPSGNYKTNGKYSGYYDFISINPQFGKRFTRQNTAFTITGGIDYTTKLDRGDNFEFTDENGKSNTISHSGGEPEVNDLRITFGGMLSAKRWGLGLNYKIGLTNYNTYSTEKVTSRLLQLRLLYTILQKRI